MKLGLCTIAIALLGAAFALPADASMTAAMDLNALVDASDHVVLGEAVWDSAHWDGDERIVTEVRLVVEDAMKGPLEPGDETIVTLLGGVVGDVGMRVTGEAQLPVGTRAIVFGAEDVRGGMLRVRPVGMAQGVLPVVDDGGGDVVQPGGQGLALVRRGPDGVLHAARGALDGPRPFGEVRDAILERARAAQ